MALSMKVKDFEFIYIGPDIRISVRRHSRTITQIWVDAPQDFKILRDKHLKDQESADVEPAPAD